MIKCADCGTERKIGKFCPMCGSTNIVPEQKPGIKCANCGKIRARGKFCPECGSPKIDEGPKVMVCTDCGTVRKTGKCCPECGCTNVTYKPASELEKSAAISEKTEAPVTPVNAVSIQDDLASNDFKPLEIPVRSKESSTKKISKENETPKIDDITKVTTEILTDNDNFDIFVSEAVAKTTAETTPEVSSYIQPAVQLTVQPTVQPAVQPAVQPVVQPIVQPAVQPVAQSTATTSAAAAYSTTQATAGPYVTFNSSQYADQQYLYSGYQKPPRTPDSLKQSSDAVKKCKLIFFILIGLEMIGMFLPLRTASALGISESISLADVSGLVIMLGLFMLTIQAVLVFFAQYIGAAIGLIIQTLITSFSSIFVAALSSEDKNKYTSIGIGWIVMMAVPFAMIFLSIVTAVKSAKSKKNPH